MFQHSLVRVVRSNPQLFGSHSSAQPNTSNASSPAWSGLPIIFDEVFTGLYRLGRFTSSSFLGVQPDISVHAKLLTGGLIPLCTTLASQSIFEAFLSDEKSDALLHGHSYTAHAVGCKVAETSLRTMLSMDEAGQWASFKQSWQGSAALPQSHAEHGAAGVVWSMWSKDFVEAVSDKQPVDSVFALGSVLAISLHDESGSGKDAL